MNKKIVHTLSLCMLLSIFMSQAAFASPNSVKVFKDDQGFKIQVDEKDLFVKAINWSHKPVGKNYRYSLWDQKESYIKAVITQEMELLNEMGATAIVSGGDIPKIWVTYIYKKYGIMTILSYEMGRWGVTYNGVWIPIDKMDFEDAGIQKMFANDISELVEKYKNTSGILAYAIGSSHNWGMSWSNERINTLPNDDQWGAKADVIYSIIGKYTDLIKSKDTNHPVILVNGEVDQIERINTHCPNIDIYGANVNRGPVSGGIYKQFTAQMKDKPFLYFSLGGNLAWDDKKNREDVITQARTIQSQWKEIYQETYGKGTGAAIGATMGWQDDWSMAPKFDQQWELDVHNKTAAEWTGIVGIAPGDESKPRPVLLRPAYYFLKTAWAIDPYAGSKSSESTTFTFDTESEPTEESGSQTSQPTQSSDAIIDAFNAEIYASIYFAKNAEMTAIQSSMISVSKMEVHLELVGRADDQSIGNSQVEPIEYQSEEFVRFGVTGEPSEYLKANVQLHIAGNVATNRLNGESYNAVSKPYYIPLTDTAKEHNPLANDRKVSDNERVRIYRASVTYTGELVDIKGSYREGHNHWFDFGDFFNVYSEMYDYPTYDLWDIKAPYGAEFTGKSTLAGLRIAIGPQLTFGNPALYAMYTRKIADWTISPMMRFDIGVNDLEGAPSSIEKQQKTSQYAVSAQSTISIIDLKVGVMFASPEKIGLDYAYTEEITPHNNGSYFNSQGYEVYNAATSVLDAFGGKLQAVTNLGKLQILTTGTYMGLLASGGWNKEGPLTGSGWALRDQGGSNKMMATLGVAYTLGNLQIAPNAMFQKPLVGPMPSVAPLVDTEWTVNNYRGFYRGLSPRRGDQDPFTANARETYAGELLFTFDPTPSTKLHHWDEDNQEDAFLAGFLSLVYKNQPTVTDDHTYDDGNGNKNGFGKGQAAEDVYSGKLKVFSKPGKSTRAILSMYYDHKQSTGPTSDNPIDAYGGDVTLVYDQWNFKGGVKIDDWGPYDFQMQFNESFPLQTNLDISYGLSNLGVLEIDKTSKIGIGASFRTLDDTNSPQPDGITELDTQIEYELELRTYISVNI